jgi:hypothetical protein
VICKQDSLQKAHCISSISTAAECLCSTVIAYSRLSADPRSLEEKAKGHYSKKFLESGKDP